MCKIKMGVLCHLKFNEINLKNMREMGMERS